MIILYTDCIKTLTILKNIIKFYSIIFLKEIQCCVFIPFITNLVSSIIIKSSINTSVVFSLLRVIRYTSICYYNTLFGSSLNRKTHLILRWNIYSTMTLKWKISPSNIHKNHVLAFSSINVIIGWGAFLTYRDDIPKSEAKYFTHRLQLSIFDYIFISIGTLLMQMWVEKFVTFLGK